MLLYCIVSKNLVMYLWFQFYFGSFLVLVTPPTPTVSSGYCVDSTWKHFGGSCYYIALTVRITACFSILFITYAELCPFDQIKPNCKIFASSCVCDKTVMMLLPKMFF